MSALARLAAFGAGLVLLLVLALGLGRALGGATDEEMGMEMSTATMDHEMTGPGEPEASPTEPAGLAIASERFRLEPDATSFDSPGREPLRFRVVDPNGVAVTDFTEEQARELHLIVVGRDLSGYQHLHPTRDSRGVWSVEADFERAGPYRVFADFVSGGERTTLGYDVAVAGGYRPLALERPATSARTAGYEVSADEPASGALEFSVTRDGEPVDDLEDYLGAKGHLVVLREGDLAYLHVHPEAQAEPGTIAFMAHYPSAGRYRLYLQFKHEGQVRTAELTKEVGDAQH